MIRTATSADVDRIFELICELAIFEKLEHKLVGTAEMLRAALFGDPATAWCVVYEVDGVVQAYALYYFTFSTFRVLPGIWLEDLYVTPTLRGQGIGRQLIDHLVEIAKARGHGRVEWSVLDWNVDAINFYKKIGAEILEDWRICRVSL